MTRSQPSKDTLDIAAGVALVAALVAAAAYVFLAMQESDDLTGIDAVLFIAFGAGCVTILGCSAVFFEDLRRIGASRAQQGRWVAAWLVTGPVALLVYWWRYVRGPKSPNAGRPWADQPATTRVAAERDQSRSTMDPMARAAVYWFLGFPLLIITAIAIIVVLSMLGVIGQ